jgi:subfamily B ATP-binding cassette protein MsbA
LGVAAQRVINEVRKQVQRHVLRLPVRAFDATQTGVLISRIMNDAEGIRNLVGTGLVQLVGGSVTAVIALGVLLWINWQLTLFLLVVLAIFGGVMAVAFRRLRPVFRERGKIQADITGRLTQTLGGIRVVKAYTAEPAEEAVFHNGVERLFGNIRTAMTGVSLVTAFGTVILGVLGVVMTLVGGRAILDGSMTTGDFVLYLVFIGLVAAPVIEIASIGTQITEAFAGLDRIREIRGQAREDEGDAQRTPCPRLVGDVVFDKVSFEYEPAKPVLHGISLRAKAGSTTALVGSSGSGKSTLVSLVMAFNRPLSGRVLVDGLDLAQVRLREYREQLGVVLQENFLFDGTVAENIAFSRPLATRAEIEAAAALAYCDEFVRGFEHGYDTLVGERGVKLSGGQRQRIAIARALLADPRILILDEATSSLDSESEAVIQKSLAQLRHSRTTFVIAHRLSTIRAAEQILVIEGGRIVEQGTHGELYALGGRYRELHDRQHQLEQERYANPGEEPRQALASRP